jgi:hypothetical protein
MEHKEDFIKEFRELKIPDDHHSRYLQLCNQLGIDHPLDFSFCLENELVKCGFLQKHAEILKKKYKKSMRDNAVTTHKNIYKERR